MNKNLFLILGIMIGLAASPAVAQEEDPFQVPGTGEPEKKQESPVPVPPAPPKVELSEEEVQAAVAKAVDRSEKTAERTETAEQETSTATPLPADAMVVRPVGASPEATPAAPAPTEPVRTVVVQEAPKPAQSSQEIVLVDDFNGGVRSNLLGGAMGTWSKDEYDDSQGCEIDFVEHPRLGKTGGYSMQITYDVDSPAQAFNGVWIKLEGLDARPYKFLVLYLKAPNAPPFGTDRLKIELHNNKKESGSYLIDRIPKGAWREYKIPLKKFKGLKDLSALDELVIVFEDKTANPKEGILYLEQVYFTKGEIRRPQ